MTGSLTIYDCPHGHATAHTPGQRPLPPETTFHCQTCGEEMIAVRVFREEDVRPLWEAAKGPAKDRHSHMLRDALKAFPAPEEWRRRRG